MSTLPLVFMYSGQGSHYYQMGKSLFQNNPTFKNEMLKGDVICQRRLGFSVVERLYQETHNRGEVFSDILLSHPAIFMVECALTSLLRENNILPDIVLGGSLGEFAASTVAGAIDYAPALNAVINQAQTLSRFGEKGGMLAILHDYGLYYQDEHLKRTSEMAAINFQSHFVVSGTIVEIEKIKLELDKKGITSQILPVSYAFHSSLIDPLRKIFLENALMSIKENKITIISCTTGKPVTYLTTEHFWEAIRKPILFQQAIRELEKAHSYFYLDLGPSGTLATFVKYNLDSNSMSKYTSLLTPFEKEEVNIKKAIDMVHNR